MPDGVGPGVGEADGDGSGVVESAGDGESVAETDALGVREGGGVGLVAEAPAHPLARSASPTMAQQPARWPRISRLVTTNTTEAAGRGMRDRGFTALRQGGARTLAPGMLGYAQRQ